MSFPLLHKSLVYALRKFTPISYFIENILVQRESLHGHGQWSTVVSVRESDYSSERRKWRKWQCLGDYCSLEILHCFLQRTIMF